jgi:hypothetical protein
MTSGTDLNPLNAPSQGDLLGADLGPGSIPGTYMGGGKSGKERVIYKGRGAKRVPMLPKTRYEMLRTQLDQDRESWRAHILDLKNNFLPYRTRWLDDAGIPNQGQKKMQYIVDNTPALSIRTLAAGLMSGVTNPSRPWVRIKTHDKDLYAMDGVPEWCEAVTNAVLSILAKSNYYDTMEPMYREIGTFGTMAHGCYEVPWDPRKPEQPIVNYVPYTWGEYWIQQDSSSRVTTFLRDFQWTAKQIVERFVDDPYNPDDPKWANISAGTRSLWTSRSDERRMEIVQVIEPNVDWIPGSPLSKDFPIRSVYYERGGSPLQLLEVAGYHVMPVKVARWDLNSDDAWGHSPAMDCLGDAKSLQVQCKRSAQAIDKLVDPPLIGDANLKKTRVSMLPGDVTWLEGAAANSYGLKPLYEVKPDLQHMLEDRKDMRERIQASLYTDVFQMLKTMGEELKSGITATEIQARVQERILEMGPVLTRLNNELYDPQIEQLLQIGFRRSRLAWQYIARGKPVPPGVEMIFPPPPPAIKGKPLRVEYTSILSQAMKMSEIQSIQQITTYVLQAASTKPDILDKLDFDAGVDIVADRLSVPPEFIVPTDMAEKFRAARAKQAAQQQQADQAAKAVQVGAQAAKNLGSAPLGAGNALEHLLGAEPGGNA